MEQRYEPTSISTKSPFSFHHAVLPAVEIKRPEF